MKKPLILILLVAATLTTSAQKRLSPIGSSTFEVFQKEFKQTSFADAMGYRYIAAPSFSKPYALLIARKTPLMMNVSTTIQAVDKDGKYALQSDSATVCLLASLITMSVSTAMEPFENAGLDGTSYFFVNNVNYAETWTPKENTNCERLVRLMDAVFKAVKTGDKALLEAQKSEAKALVSIFKSYYPKDVFETEALVQGVFNPYIGAMSYDINLKNYHMSTTFKIAQKDYQKGMEQQLVAKYGAVLEEAAKWLFLNTSAMDLKTATCPLSITVDDEAPRCFSSTPMYGASFTIHGDDIAKDKLIDLFRKALK